MDYLLFSGSNSRFVLTTGERAPVFEISPKEMVPIAVGGILGESLEITVGRSRLDFKLAILRDAYVNTLEDLDHWQK